MKIFKSRKALSPVVASIILIAVTVAVSIAVAAWMGALTFQFTNTEQISITSVTFGTNSILVIANNTGTSPVIINSVRVNTVVQTTTNPALPESIAANHGLALNITYTVTQGYNYNVELESSKGNKFLYTAVAPTS